VSTKIEPRHGGHGWLCLIVLVQRASATPLGSGSGRFVIVTQRDAILEVTVGEPGPSRGAPLAPHQLGAGLRRDGQIDPLRGLRHLKSLTQFPDTINDPWFRHENRSKWIVQARVPQQEVTEILKGASQKDMLLNVSRFRDLHVGSQQQNIVHDWRQRATEHRDEC
jgi:hypothetical protein